MDALVRDKIHNAFGFRFIVVDDYRTAIQVESIIKSGRLPAGRPRLTHRAKSSPQQLALTQNGRLRAAPLRGAILANS